MTAGDNAAYEHQQPRLLRDRIASEILPRIDANVASLWGAVEMFDLTQSLIHQRDGIRTELQPVLHLLLSLSTRLEQDLHELEGWFQSLTEAVSSCGVAQPATGTRP